MQDNLSTNHIPLLLTSSVIAHDTSVKLTDAQTRISLGLKSVQEWLRIRPLAPIVLCDGSGHDFSAQVLARFPHARIECLYFDNDAARVQQLGRGFGEGEIVKYAINHSREIARAGCFAKCTSKLWVENFHQCLSHWNHKILCRGIFLNVFDPWKSTRWHHIDTRFYVASVDFYRNYFLEAHQRIASSHGLEECFMDVVQTALTSKQTSMQGVLFSVSPQIYGVGGGIGQAYKLPLHRRLKEQLRLSLTMRQPKFAKLFSQQQAYQSPSAL